jgi:hypothetical protein
MDDKSGASRPAGLADNWALLSGRERELADLLLVSY